jgi:hypothetical protein
MALFVWIGVATALWHFTIFVPDRWPAGIVGAFACANAGALLVGMASNGMSIPSLALVSHADAVIGAVGGVLGLVAGYAYGVRKERIDSRRSEQD